MAVRGTVVVTSKRVEEIENELNQLQDEKEQINKIQKSLKDELNAIIRGAEAKRTMNWRVGTKRTGGQLDARAIARHFGCSTSFLSQFRRYTSSKFYLSKAKPPVNPIPVNVDEVQDA